MRRTQQCMSYLVLPRCQAAGDPEAVWCCFALLSPIMVDSLTLCAIVLPAIIQTLCAERADARFSGLFALRAGRAALHGRGCAGPRLSRRHHHHPVRPPGREHRVRHTLAYAAIKVQMKYTCLAARTAAVTKIAVNFNRCLSFWWSARGIHL